MLPVALAVVVVMQIVVELLEPLILVVGVVDLMVVVDQVLSLLVIH
jgi:hypothetical protein